MVRINGLVREARRAQQALRGGLLPEERSPFLERVRRAIRKVEGILAEDGVGEGALSVPSRNALDVLRRVAATPEGELPEPRPGEAQGRRVLARNVVGSLERVLSALEDGSAEADVRERVRREAHGSAEAIERFCETEGAEPSSLSPRSRDAYSMLRWLSAPENVARYADQVARVVRVVPAAFDRLEVPAPHGALVRFEPGRLLWRVRLREDALLWRLSVGFLAAGDAEIEDLVARAVFRRKAGAAAARLREFCESEDFAALVADLDLVASPPSSARGRAYDLDALFLRLDAAHFHGSVARPRLEWVSSLSRRLFGYYAGSRDLVGLNAILDDPAVPEVVAEVVLYHELLHKKHGTRRVGSRRHSHTPEFRAEERLHPGFEEARRWMRRLAGGRSLDDEASEEAAGVADLRR